MNMDIFSSKDTAALDEAVEVSEQISEKFVVFRNGLIPPHLSLYQLHAYKIYDSCSDRQSQVLELRLRNQTFKEIGLGLGVGESTVKVHWYRLLKKLSSITVEVDETR